MNREEALEALGGEATEAKRASTPKLMFTEKKGTFVLGEVIDIRLHKFPGNQNPTKFVTLKVEATDMRVGVKTTKQDDDGNPVYDTVPLPDDNIVSFAAPSRFARLDIKVGQRIHSTYLGKSSSKPGTKPGHDHKTLVSGEAKTDGDDI
jgi:hypothetical protein